MTLGQYGFELCKATSLTQKFFSVVNAVLHDLRLVESEDVKLQYIEGQVYNICRFLTTWWVGAPNPAAV